ncbi:MAG: CHAT domain-containing protein [Bacteroidota bacterium]
MKWSLQPLLCLFFVLILFTFPHLYAQDMKPEAADSLLQRAEQALQQKQYNEVNLWAEEAAKAFEAAGNWVSYVRAKNTLAEWYLRQREPSDGKAILESILAEDADKLSGKDRAELAYAHKNLGIAYAQGQEYQKAEAEWEKAREITLATVGDEADILAELIGNLATVASKMGDSRKSIRAYQEMLSFYRKKYPENHRVFIKVYQDLGIEEGQLRNFEQAYAYFDQALSISRKVYQGPHGTQVEIYQSIADLQRLQNQYQASIATTDRALAIAEQLGQAQSEHYLRTKAQNLLVKFYFRDFDENYQEYRQLLRAYDQFYGPRHPKVIEAWKNLGRFSKDFQQFPRADQALKTAISLFDTTDVDQLSLQIDTWDELGRLGDYQGKFSESVKAYEKALSLMGYETTGRLVKKEGSDLFTQKAGYDLQIAVLTDYLQAHMALYATEKIPSSVDRALEAANYGFQILDKILREVESAEGRQGLVSFAYPFLSFSLEAAYRKWLLTEDPVWIEKAFDISERSKAYELLSSARSQQQLAHLVIPEELESAINQAEAQRFQLQEKGFQLDQHAETTEAATLQAELLLLETRFDSLLAILEKDYPAYYQIKFGDAPLPVTEAQRALNQDEALVSYFVGRQWIWILVLEQEKLRFFPAIIPDSDTWPQPIEKFRASLTDPTVSLQDHHRMGYDLYDLFMDSVITGLSPNISKLVIIPDGSLGHLPIENFITTPYSDSTGHEPLRYLMEDYQIHYGYSVSLWLTQKQKRAGQQPSRLFGGFAASYDQFSEKMADSLSASQPMLASLVRSGEAPLPGAIREVSFIADLLGGEAYLGKEANEATFKSEAGKYRILHLAMHTLLADRNPLYSQFIFTPESDTTEDNLLLAAELYQMKLPAEMAVLSACNTGFGQVRRGEGVMSLSRAFTIAGCPSIIMSLWKVPDQTTEGIMRYFYEGLKEGKRKDEALHWAKKTYLERTQAVERKHPFYWAGFIAIGDMKPVDFSHPLSPWIWIGGVLAVLVLAGLWYRNVNQQKKQQAQSASA